MMSKILSTALALCTAALAAGTAHAQPLTFEKVWTHGHTTPGQVSEIPAYDAQTHTIWVAGVLGADVLGADTGDLIEHIDVTSSGFVNSVAIYNGLAALAVEAAPDRRNPGKVLLYDTGTRAQPGRLRGDRPPGAASRVEYGLVTR